MIVDIIMNIEILRYFTTEKQEELFLDQGHFLFFGVDQRKNVLKILTFIK